jgi:PPE-repeat protein
MLAAAAAWDGLAAELAATAAGCESAVESLTSGSWIGPASAAMGSAAAPYLAWLHTTAGQATQTATQARAAAGAYEAAFAATVPPSVVTANRTLLASLIATNIVGQNTAEIAATEAAYAEMWAQDAAAMYGYSAAAATAAELTPFTSPKQVSDPAGQGAQAAAVAQATGTTAANNTQNALAGVPQLLHQLAMPLQAAPVQAVVDPGVGEATAAGVSGLTVSSAYHTAIGSANFFQRVATQFQSAFATSNEPSTTDIMDRVNRIGLVTGAVTPDEVGTAADGSPLGTLGLGGFEDWHGWWRFFSGLGAGLKISATADMGQAPLVGGLSVPQNWVATAPAVQLASVEVPGAGAAAAPAATGGVGTLGAQAAVAGMAGRALAGAVLPGRESARPTTDEKPSSNAAKAIAEALREYAALRDAGIITDVEFNKHKERLMSLDPLSGR